MKTRRDFVYNWRMKTGISVQRGKFLRQLQGGRLYGKLEINKSAEIIAAVRWNL